MTSELKPCPFCGSQVQVNEYTDKSFSVTCTSECVHIQASSKQDLKAAIEKWNTRATPSADTLAGLVRYAPDSYQGRSFMEEDANGEYVLHSEAAKVVAAKDAEIAVGDAAIKQNALLWKRAEDAEAKLGYLEAFEKDLCAMLGVKNDDEALRSVEALLVKLAQIKAQEPVMWLCVHDDRGSDRAITTPSPSRRDILNADGYEITPLYASPLAPEGGKN